VTSENRIALGRQAVTTAERERTIALLSDSFARGELEMERFEELLTLAHRASTADELTALTADLSVPAAQAAPVRAIELACDVPTRGSVLAVFGGTRRNGAWTVPRHMHVTAIFGGVEIDLRDARLPAGTIDLYVRAVFGGVEIIVPPTLAVEIHGSAILGGFDQMERTPASPDPGVPVLRIHGTAILGGVNVDTRLPGESSRMAHRRNRWERRAARHARHRHE